MKKLICSSLILFSIATLTACSTSKKTTNPSSDVERSTSQSSTKASSDTTKVDNSQYDAIVNKLNSELNPDGTMEFEAKIKNNVIDSEYPEGHNVIMILLTGEAKKTIEELQTAIDSNTATADQKNAISLLQMVISQMAKELPDDTTTIDLGYEIAADQYTLIAKSSKVKDIIPINDLVVE